MLLNLLAADAAKRFVDLIGVAELHHNQRITNSVAAETLFCRQPETGHIERTGNRVGNGQMLGLPLTANTDQNDNGDDSNQSQNDSAHNKENGSQGEIAQKVRLLF